jgi:hypothetical protein
MFNNTTQVVKQGAEDFTVGFDSGRGVTTISNMSVKPPSLLADASWEINPCEGKCLVLKSNNSCPYSMSIVLNLLIPSFYSTNHQYEHKKIVRSAHTAHFYLFVSLL